MNKLTMMYLLGSKACMVKCSIPEPVLEKHSKNMAKKYNNIFKKREKH
jgi:hypothetical protein